MKTAYLEKVLETLKGLDLSTIDGEFRAIDLLTKENLAESRSMARKILSVVKKSEEHAGVR